MLEEAEDELVMLAEDESGDEVSGVATTEPIGPVAKVLTVAAELADSNLEVQVSKR